LGADTSGFRVPNPLLQPRGDHDITLVKTDADASPKIPGSFLGRIIVGGAFWHRPFAHFQKWWRSLSDPSHKPPPNTVTEPRV